MDFGRFKTPQKESEGFPRVSFCLGTQLLVLAIDCLSFCSALMNVKTRFSSLDTAAMSKALSSSLVGKKLSNVYDIDDKTYLMKFSCSGESEKTMVLIESGIRVHPTRFLRDKSALPSPFSMKLRKHLKGKRLDCVQQVGMDRAIDMRFGSGDTANHVLVELYREGNIVITDFAYTVLSCLRTHKFENDIILKVGDPYPISSATTITKSSPAESITSLLHSKEYFCSFAAMKEQENIDWHQSNQKKVKKLYLKQALLSKESGISDLGPEILDHCFLKCGLSSSTKAEEVRDLDVKAITALQESLTNGWQLFQLLRNSENPQGYLVYADGDAHDRYAEFVPLLLEQHSAKRSKGMGSFVEAVDEYYSKIEEQKMQLEVRQLEMSAKQKIEKVKQARTDQINSIAARQRYLALCAGLIEMHAVDLDKLALVLNSATSNGMSWDEIQSMVDDEKANGNPIAALVFKLQLSKNAVTVRLRNFDVALDQEDDDSDSDTDEERTSSEKKACKAFVLVEVDLGLSAHANARNMFQSKKLAMINEEKTVKASVMAVNNVEDKVMRQLESQKIQKSLKSVRKIHWFEKFAWFITTEGYLVISGRDATQNDIIVNKYMREDDVYVHADVPGASLCLLRRKHSEKTGASPAAAVSPYAIHEAGNFCMCRSSAWVTKVVTSPWWVWGAQVRRVGPAGDVLPKGTFAIQGKKNLLPPMPFEMGFGIMFRLDDASAERHANDRKDKAILEDDMVSVLSEAADRYNLDTCEAESVDCTSVPEAISGTMNSSALQYKAPFPEKTPSPAFYAGNSDVPDEAEEERQESDGENEAEDSSQFSRAKKDVHDSSKPPAAAAGAKKKKKIDKKKARRYAEQDEEDKELAMQSLGHGKTGEKLKDKIAQRSKEASDIEIAKKMERVGITDFMSHAQTEARERTPPPLLAALDGLTQAGLLAEQDVEAEHLRMLSTLGVESGLHVLELFAGALKEFRDKGSPASAPSLLTSTIVRFQKNKNKMETVKIAYPVGAGEQQEVAVLSQDRSGISGHNDDLGKDAVDLIDEDEQAAADDITSITGTPMNEDVLLYAVPCCGPFSAIKDFKYRVKITPGALKKSKVAKMAITAFTHNSFVSDAERNLMLSLSDTEMTATLVAEIKINMPGLQQVKRELKQEVKNANNKQRGQKKK